MSNQLKVVVWSKEGCSYCTEVKGYLQENNIEFTTIDVTNRNELRDILDVKYGIRHVPVVEIGKNGTYKSVTKVGLEHLIIALATANK